MANPLTGDFEAVLQVSGGTINRLLASMHQNAFADRDVPSFPHSVRMRIGDDYALDGVRGVVHAQVSVPRVELIHGATDRFILEVGVRAWYRPDPGTEPMPAYIHGTVHAEYRVHEIDPSCLWPGNPADYIWIRVVRDSVRFQGTAEDEADVWEVSTASPGDPSANIAKITHQTAVLLARRFEARPHRVSKRFRRGSLRSLNATIGGPAVAVPLRLPGGPGGDIHSIDNVLLNGFDLAVAVDIGYIMAHVNSALDPMRTFNPSIPVDGITVYRVGVHPPSVQWLPQGSYGVFKIRASGWANTDSVLPNATFSFEQDVTLNFGSGLWLAAGSLTVKAHATGIGSGMVVDRVKSALLAKVPSIVKNACDNAQPFLNQMTSTQELSSLLKTLDKQASVSLDSAEFVTHGLVMRGTIGVSPRSGVVLKQEKTAAGDAHSAFESWVPGGRIDRIEWSWTWSGSGEPGNAAHGDRFLLHRTWKNVSRWGMSLGLKTPIPGLDGWGLVCLRVIGVRVDPVTGQWVGVTSVRRCTRFGFIAARDRVKAERLFLRDMPELSKDSPFPQLQDLPLVAARAGGNGGGTANTLLIFADDSWDGETAGILRGGLEACRRYDAGLAVLVLFREGVLDTAAPRVVAEIEGFARRLGILAHVNEDVNGGWSRALELRSGPGEPAWAIITPEGEAAWTHAGRIEPPALAQALDTHLRRCAVPAPAPYRPALQIGAAVTAAALHPGIVDLAVFGEPRCPPMPLWRFRTGGTLVTFVQKRSGATATHLRGLADRYGQRRGPAEPAIVLVIDGADAREAEDLKKELGLDVVAIGDRAGKIADRFGVDLWPTMVELDRAGIVSEVEAGIAAQPDRERFGEEENETGPGRHCR